MYNKSVSVRSNHDVVHQNKVEAAVRPIHRLRHQLNGHFPIIRLYELSPNPTIIQKSTNSSYTCLSIFKYNACNMACMYAKKPSQI